MRKTKEELFLQALRETGNVSRAAQRARIGRRTAYDMRESDAAFSASWLEALEEAADRLELEARRRAVEGTLRPVYQGGEKVGEVREYSDTLLICLLRATRPEKFRENHRVELHQTGREILITEIVVERPAPAEEEAGAFQYCPIGQED